MTGKWVSILFIGLTVFLLLAMSMTGALAGVNEASLLTSAGYGSTSRISVKSDGEQANGYSMLSSLSGDGRFVVFYSYSSNLVNGDDNGEGDIFVHDRQNNQTNLVSIASDGTQGNNESYCYPSISDNGRYVAFSSESSNLVEGDTNDAPDTFVHDIISGTTEWISANSSGHQKYTLGTTITPISSDGRYVAFDTSANNLVSGDDNEVFDVFVRDRVLGQTERVSVASDGTQANGNSWVHSISGDGRYVTFSSFADNLVSGETNYNPHIYLHDRQSGTTEIVSVASNGSIGNGGSSTRSEISDDGRFVVFESGADNLDPEFKNPSFNVFLRDRLSGTTKIMAVASDGTYGNDESTSPAISSDGRFITYVSYSTNLVPGGETGISYIYLHDRETGVTERVSLSSSGDVANDWSIYPDVSDDGSIITFTSNADNLVSGDTNEVQDIFVRDRFGLKLVFVPIVLR